MSAIYDSDATYCSEVEQLIKATTSQQTKHIGLVGSKNSTNVPLRRSQRLAQKHERHVQNDLAGLENIRDSASKNKENSVKSADTKCTKLIQDKFIRNSVLTETQEMFHTNNFSQNCHISFNAILNCTSNNISNEPMSGNVPLDLSKKSKALTKETYRQDFQVADGSLEYKFTNIKAVTEVASNNGKGSTTEADEQKCLHTNKYRRRKQPFTNKILESEKSPSMGHFKKISRGIESCRFQNSLLSKKLPSEGKLKRGENFTVGKSKKGSIDIPHTVKQLDSSEDLSIKNSKRTQNSTENLKLISGKRMKFSGEHIKMKKFKNKINLTDNYSQTSVVTKTTRNLRKTTLARNKKINMNEPIIREKYEINTSKTKIKQKAQNIDGKQRLKTTNESHTQQEDTAKRRLENENDKIKKEIISQTSKKEKYKDTQNIHTSQEKKELSAKNNYEDADRNQFKDINTELHLNSSSVNIPKIIQRDENIQLQKDSQSEKFSLNRKNYMKSFDKNQFLDKIRNARNYVDKLSAQNSHCNKLNASETPPTLTQCFQEYVKTSILPDVYPSHFKHQLPPEAVLIGSLHPQAHSNLYVITPDPTISTELLESSSSSPSLPESLCELFHTKDIKDLLRVEKTYRLHNYHIRALALVLNLRLEYLNNVLDKIMNISPDVLKDIDKAVKMPFVPDYDLFRTSPNELWPSNDIVLNSQSPKQRIMSANCQ